MGCLVDLYKRFGKQSAKRFEIIADEERSCSLLAAAHLHTILPIVERPPQLIAECLVLALCDTGPPATRPATSWIATVRRLSELGGPNQEVFNRIANQLELELEKEIEKKRVTALKNVLRLGKRHGFDEKPVTVPDKPGSTLSGS